jgi:hypothetical protein
MAALAIAVSINLILISPFQLLASTFEPPTPFQPVPASADSY